MYRVGSRGLTMKRNGKELVPERPWERSGTTSWKKERLPGYGSGQPWGINHQGLVRDRHPELIHVVGVKEVNCFGSNIFYKNNRCSLQSWGQGRG